MFRQIDIAYSGPGRKGVSMFPGSTKVLFVEAGTFDDGELDVRIPELHSVCGQKVLYVANWSPGMRMTDLACLMAIAENSPDFLDILIPFSGAATMERESVEGEIAMANVEAKLLSCLPGRKRIVIPDLHTLQNKFYFQGASVRLPSLVPHLLALLRERGEKDESPFVVVFPDEGAKKRYAKELDLGPDQPLCCSKERIGEERVVRVEDAQRAAGRRVVIVDDLVRTGGTLMKCARALRAASATKVVVIVPHSVLPGDAAERIEACEDIDLFLTTDSVIGVSEKVHGLSKFGVYPIAGILA